MEKNEINFSEISFVAPQENAEAPKEEAANQPAEPQEAAVTSAECSSVEKNEEKIEEESEGKSEAEECTKEKIEENAEKKAEEKKIENNPDFKDVINAIWAHSRNMKQTIQATKQKDANFNRAVKELQAYRDGYEKSLFKSIALSTIALRENSRKAYMEFSSVALTIDNAKKYLKYITYDFEDLLSDLGIDVDEDKIRYNGKDINNIVEKKLVAPEMVETIVDEIVPNGILTVENVFEYLTQVENRVIELVKDNENLDRALSVYVANSELYDQGIHQVVLYPVVRKIADYYKETSKDVEELLEAINEENAQSSYLKALTKVIDRFENVLVLCGVTIDSYVSDTLDSKKHKILKTIPTEDESLSKTVAKKYTDCYIMDDKIIYQQKVDIYLKK